MKKLIALSLALVLVLGICACGAAPDDLPNQPPQSEPATTATETTAPEEFSINEALLDLSMSKLYDCGGKKVRPFPSDLDGTSNETAILMCHAMATVLLNENEQCCIEDFQQAGVNLAWMMLHMRDSACINSLRRIAEEVFNYAKTIYTMDQLYPWALVGLHCPKILLEYFSSDFGDSPDAATIEILQRWIPNILHLHGSDELEKAIDENPWFFVEHLDS